jgi:hypothetical protein
MATTELGMLGAFCAGFGLTGEWREGVIEGEWVTPWQPHWTIALSGWRCGGAPRSSAGRMPDPAHALGAADTIVTARTGRRERMG